MSPTFFMRLMYDDGSENRFVWFGVDPYLPLCSLRVLIDGAYMRVFGSPDTWCGVGAVNLASAYRPAGVDGLLTIPEETP